MCLYYPEDPGSDGTMLDADVDVYVDADIGFFQFGKNDAWDPISISDIHYRFFLQEDNFTS